MKRLTRSLVPAVLALCAAASIASAQTAPNATPTGPARHGHNRPSAETLQRMQDGRFAMIKGALKLTEPQQKLWQPVEDLLRARQAQRVKAMDEMAAKRDANAPRPSFADRLDRDSAQMTKRAEDLKTFANVYRPFFDSLTAEQKTVAGPLMAELSGGGRRHMGGHRWASRDQHRERPDDAKPQ